MDDTNNTLFQYFDLEDNSTELREEFLEEVAETLLTSVLRKAWMELDADKKEQLAGLLEESNADPENKEKHTAVLAFLDEYIVNLREFIGNEFETLQTAYKTTRDELLDALP